MPNFDNTFKIDVEDQWVDFKDDIRCFIKYVLI